MITGGLMIVIVSFVFDGTPLPMIATIAICAFGSFLVSLATLGFSKMPVQDAAQKKVGAGFRQPGCAIASIVVCWTRRFRIRQIHGARHDDQTDHLACRWPAYAVRQC